MAPASLPTQCPTTATAEWLFQANQATTIPYPLISPQHNVPKRVKNAKNFSSEGFNLILIHNTLLNNLGLKND